MERVVEISNKKFAIGLEWNKLTGRDPQLAARALSKSRKSPMGLLLAVEVDDGSIVNHVGLSNKKFKGSIYSAGATLARVQPNVIAVEELEDGIYWLAVTWNGRVLPGHDIATSDTEIKKMLQDLANDIELDYMQFLMEDDVAAKLGITENENQSPFSVIASTPVDDGLKLKKLAGTPNSVYLGIFLVLAIGGMYGFYQYQQVQKQRELEALMAEEAMNLEEIEKNVTVEKVIDKGPTEADLLRAARQQEIEWLKQEFNDMNTMPLIKHVLLIKSKLPESTAGWDFKSLNFVSTTKGSIVTTWERKFGSPRTFKLAMNSASRVGFTPDAKQASASYDIDLGSRGIEDILGMIQNQGTHHQEFMSALIENGLVFASEIKPQENRRETIKGIKDSRIANMAQLELRVREFKVDGDNLPKLVTLGKILENVDNFIPVSITIENNSGKTIWSLAGKLYE